MRLDEHREIEHEHRERLELLADHFSEKFVDWISCHFVKHVGAATTENHIEEVTRLQNTVQFVMLLNRVIRRLTWRVYFAFVLSLECLSQTLHLAELERCQAPVL